MTVEEQSLSTRDLQSPKICQKLHIQHWRDDPRTPLRRRHKTQAPAIYTLKDFKLVGYQQYTTGAPCTSKISLCLKFYTASKPSIKRPGGVCSLVGGGSDPRRTWHCGGDAEASITLFPMLECFTTYMPAVHIRMRQRNTQKDDHSENDSLYEKVKIMSFCSTAQSPSRTPSQIHSSSTSACHTGSLSHERTVYSCLHNPYLSPLRNVIGSMR